MKRILAFGMVAVVLAAGTAWSLRSENPSNGGLEPAVTDTALFAGGCFWCMHGAFLPEDGVVEVVSGFAGGHVPDPTYEQVVRGGTGHAEAVLVRYDPEVIGYDELLKIYWYNIDPDSLDGQFCDRGDQYRPEIFALTGDQRTAALASRETVSTELGREIRVPVSGPTDFYPAPDYHQEYFLKNPNRYRLYRKGCGQDARLEEVWGEPPKL